MKMEEQLAELIRTELGPDYAWLARNPAALVDLAADGLQYRRDLIDDLNHAGAIPPHLAPEIREVYEKMRGRQLSLMLDAVEAPLGLR